MPNWCENRWYITGAPERVRECYDLITEKQEDGSRRMTFEKLEPVPEILMKMGVNTSLVDGESVREKVVRETTADGQTVDRPLTQEEEEERAATGAEDLGDWKKKHWGAGMGRVRDSEEFSIDESDACLTFHSAWRPPDSFFYRLCREFPDLTLGGTYKEPGVGLFGGLQSSDPQAQPCAASSDAPAAAEPAAGM